MLERIAAEVGGAFVTRELVTPFASVGYAPDQLPPHAAMVAVGSPVSRTWTYAGAARAHTLVIVDASRAAHYLNSVILGLFAITAGPEDFIARLHSRDAWTGGPFNPKLLRDTAHHVARALNDHFGRRCTEEEKAVVFETLWRHAQFGLPRGAGNDGDPLPRLHFLSDSHLYRWLEERVRAGTVHTIWGDGRTHMCSEDVRGFLAHHDTAMGLLCLGSPDVFDVAAWQRVPRLDECLVTTDDMPGVPYATLVTPPPTEPATVRLDLSAYSGEALHTLLGEALHHPHAAILDAVFARVRDTQDTSTPLLAYCASLGSEDYWTEACVALLDASPEDALLMGNALAHALALDVI